MLAGTGAVACSCDIIGNVLDTVADIFNDVANRVAGIVYGILDTVSGTGIAVAVGYTVVVAVIAAVIYIAAALGRPCGSGAVAGIAGIVVFGGLCLVCHIVIVHVAVVLSAGREDTDIKYHKAYGKNSFQFFHNFTPFAENCFTVIVCAIEKRIYLKIKFSEKRKVRKHGIPALY